MRKIDSLAYWHQQGPGFFRELSSFGAMPARLKITPARGCVLSLSPGESLYFVGDRCEAICIVLSGKVGTWMPRKDAGMTFAFCYEPGDDMAFVPMIALADRPAGTKADEGSVVLEISCVQFLDLHQQETDAFGQCP